MASAVGTILLSLAWLSCLSALVLEYGIKRGQYANLTRTFMATSASCFFAVLSFGYLIYLFIATDVSIELVAKHSHPVKPLLYKITGTWGNHEGSILLFVCLLAVLNLLYISISSYSLKRKITIHQLMLQWLLISYVLFTSNPFAPNSTGIAPVGLNPILQDIGLAIHPPVLYIGYVLLSLSWSFSMAGMSAKVDPKLWAIELKPWVMAAVGILTFGIALGSWWAYRELGWGGYWFWDPVENVSLMPWLTGLALLHSLLMTAGRGQLFRWSILLGLITFCLCLMGFFLVRSGILTSVHAFASDPTRGLAMLVIIAIVGGVSLTLYSVKYTSIANKVDFALVSRETGILVNNLFMLVLLMVTALGTLYPIIAQMFFNSFISVGPPYYHQVWVPMALLACVFAAVVPRLRWQEQSVAKAGRQMLLPFGCALFIAVVLIITGEPVMHILAIFVAVLLLVSIATQTKKSVRYYAMTTSHVGLALFIIAVAINTKNASDEQFMVSQGETVEFEGYDVTLEKLNYGTAKNYFSRKATVLFENPNVSFSLFPENRIFPVEGTVTSESSIYSTLFYDVYAVTGEIIDEEKGVIGLRLYYRPMIRWIWLSAILMGLGCLLSVAYYIRRGR